MLISIQDLQDNFFKKGDSTISERSLLELKQQNDIKQNAELLLYIDQALVLINDNESIKKRRHIIYEITQSVDFQSYSPFLKYTFYNSLYLLDYKSGNYLEALDQMITSANILEESIQNFESSLVKVYYRIGYISSFYLGDSEKSIVAYEVALKYSILAKDQENQQKLLYNLCLLEYDQGNYIDGAKKGLDAINTLKNIAPLNYDKLWRNLYPSYIQCLAKLNDFKKIKVLYKESVHEFEVGNIHQKVFDEFIHSILYSLVLVGMDDEFNFHVKRFSNLKKYECENMYVFSHVYSSLSLYNRMNNKEQERNTLLDQLKNSECGLENKYYRNEYLKALNRLIELDIEKKDLLSLNKWYEKKLSLNNFVKYESEAYVKQINFWFQKNINYLEGKANNQKENFDLSKRFNLTAILLVGLFIFFLWKIKSYNKELNIREKELVGLNSDLLNINIELNENIELSNKQQVDINLQNEELKNYNKIINEKNLELSVELKAQLLFTSNSIKVFNNLVNQIDEKVKNISTKTYLKKIIKENLNENIWSEVDHKFLQVNEEFFKILSIKFPKLTNNELKLCALLRMNLSNKEIARIQYISPDSVKVAKFRLKKKLNINSTNVNIITFLNNLSDIKETRL